MTHTFEEEEVERFLGTWCNALEDTISDKSSAEEEELKKLGERANKQAKDPNKQQEDESEPNLATGGFYLPH